MPTLYNNSYFKKVTSILNKYLAFKANETFHPICTAYFIVNRYVPLDNKYYYYDKNFVALNYDYFRFSIRCMFFNDENSASCIYTTNVLYSEWNNAFQRIIFFKKPMLLGNRSIFSNTKL